MSRIAGVAAAFGLVSATALAYGVLTGATGHEKSVVVPAPLSDEPAESRTSEVAVLAGGCFWGVQGVYQHVEGVSRAVSGYAGGDRSTAEYETVSGGDTGHAEAVEITFDPRVVSYGRLLQIFFSVVHDPTQLDRQGPDHGPQYRSAIFPRSDAQARVARAYLAQLGAARVFEGPVVTTIEAGRTFYPAEGYHQDFLERNPTYPYIVFNDLPKVRALERSFPDAYRRKPALVGSNF